MTIQQWAKDLAQIVNPNNIKINESLKKYTMTKLGAMQMYLSYLKQKMRQHKS